MSDFQLPCCNIKLLLSLFYKKTFIKSTQFNHAYKEALKRPETRIRISLAV